MTKITYFLAILVSRDTETWEMGHPGLLNRPETPSEESRPMDLTEPLHKIRELAARVTELEEKIRHNKESFYRLKAQAQSWRDRALRAEAALEEARRAARERPLYNADPLASFMDQLRKKK